MPSSLRNNLNSAYLNAANRLNSHRGRRRIVAYVESYDDIAFWRSILSEFENDERYFQVMLPSSTSLSKGKKMVLMNALDSASLGSSLIACVDSDYDFLLQDATTTSRKLNHNPYIFQTYAYAIENYQCFAESLHEICVSCTLNDRPVLDFEAFLRSYSRIVYPLFLWNIWFYRQHDTHTFPLCDFNSATRLFEVSLKNPEAALDRLSRNVQRKQESLQRQFPELVEKVEQLGNELVSLGLTPETTYLYIQGHHLLDNVVMRLLLPVCTLLRREREEEIKRLAVHDEQLHNELTGYENSLASLDLMIKKNDRYKELYLYQWVRRDLKKVFRK